MKTLAFELSTARGSIACTAAEAPIFSASFANDRKNSREFFHTLGRCLDECGTPDLLVVGIGPGAFAGMRIAIATATGLQAAWSARLVGIPSVCALETDRGEYCVIGDARRQSFFYARIQRGKCLEGPTLHSAEELRSLLARSDCAFFSSEILAAFSEAKLAHPSAVRLCNLAQRADIPVSLPPLEPLYLRAPYITIPKETLRAFSVHS